MQTYKTSLNLFIASYPTEVVTFLYSRFPSLTPLEQFEVIPTIFFRYTGCIVIVFIDNLAVTSGVVFTLLSGVLLTSSFKFNSVRELVRNSLARLVKSILTENLYIYKQQYYTVRLYLFRTLLLANLLGLLPSVFTVTSSFGLTFFFALAYFVGVNLIGVVSHGWRRSQLFLPAGVPLAITPFLVLVEGVSYIARVLSLSIRLFANRRSGHALLKILIGFALSRRSSAIFFLNILSLLPWTVVAAARGLELLIAFLQAYVFCILVSLYLNDSLNPH